MWCMKHVQACGMHHMHAASIICMHAACTMCMPAVCTKCMQALCITRVLLGCYACMRAAYVLQVGPAALAAPRRRRGDEGVLEPDGAAAYPHRASKPGAADATLSADWSAVRAPAWEGAGYSRNDDVGPAKAVSAAVWNRNEFLRTHTGALPLDWPCPGLAMPLLHALTSPAREPLSGKVRRATPTTRATPGSAAARPASRPARAAAPAPRAPRWCRSPRIGRGCITTGKLASQSPNGTCRAPG